MGEPVIPNMYEDELPEMTREQYDRWYEASWVEIVRLGPLVDDDGNIVPHE